MPRRRKLRGTRWMSFLITKRRCVANTVSVHVLLGPVAGALGKIAEGGRNWEGWSPDPYLTGK